MAITTDNSRCWRENKQPVMAVGRTHRFLQADLLEFSHSGAEQSLQSLLPLLKGRHPLRLQLAVRAALNICRRQN